MRLIAHRGNTTGPIPELENSPDYINECLSNHYDCEIDVWLVDENKWFLGHDKPDYNIPFSFLQRHGLWCHCKNMSALITLQHYRRIISFWIDGDDCTLTSNGYIWTHTNFSLPPTLCTDFSIAVMPEVHKNWNVSKADTYCAGVCSDTVNIY